MYLLQDAPKLSKAQRKNLRRAEKKAAERSQERMSVASSEVVSELDLISNEGDALSETPVIEEEESPIFMHLRNDCVQVALALLMGHDAQPCSADHRQHCHV